MKRKIKIEDISRFEGQLAELSKEDLIPLPPPYDRIEKQPPLRKLTEKQKERIEDTLDGFSAISLPKPKSKEEEEALVRKFLSGLEKMLSNENNWTFLQPLKHTLEYCVKCQLCSEACPAYVASGKQEIYRPTFRPEVLRRIINKYIKKEGKFWSKFTGGRSNSIGKPWPA